MKRTALPHILQAAAVALVATFERHTGQPFGGPLGYLAAAAGANLRLSCMRVLHKAALSPAPTVLVRISRAWFVCTLSLAWLSLVCISHAILTSLMLCTSRAYLASVPSEISAVFRTVFSLDLFVVHVQFLSAHL